MLKLPKPIIGLIYKYLDCHDCRNMQFVCKRFSQVKYKVPKYAKRKEEICKRTNMITQHGNVMIVGNNRFVYKNDQIREILFVNDLILVDFSYVTKLEAFSDNIPFNEFKCLTYLEIRGMDLKNVQLPKTLRKLKVKNSTGINMTDLELHKLTLYNCLDYTPPRAKKLISDIVKLLPMCIGFRASILMDFSHLTKLRLNFLFEIRKLPDLPNLRILYACIEDVSNLKITKLTCWNNIKLLLSNTVVDLKIYCNYHASYYPNVQKLKILQKYNPDFSQLPVLEKLRINNYNLPPILPPQIKLLCLRNNNINYDYDNIDFTDNYNYKYCYNYNQYKYYVF